MKKVLFSFLVITLVLTSCKNYDDEFDALNASIATLQSQVSSISTLQADLSAIQNTVNSLQTTLVGTGVDLSNILTEISSLQTDLNTLTTNFSDADLAALQENITLLQADVDEILESQNVDSLILNLTGLDELGDDFVYEGWLIVNGSPVSTGTFSSIDFPQSFTVNKSDLELAVTFVLTIEPAVDDVPAPSDVHILAGDFNGNSGALSISHGAALGNDFSTASGKYILATPTDGANTNENSGIWFLDLATGAPTVGLSLPTLPAGWMYEGWVVSSGSPISTGTFTSVSGMDNFNGFSGAMDGPPFPGEDFLTNAPAGMTFPLDLSSGKAVISIEPYPDNSPNPFLLKPLVGDIPANALDHTTYSLGQNLNFPSGTVSR
jgi:hypothetical protein